MILLQNIIAVIIILTCGQLSTSELIYIDEQTNFSPCILNNNRLSCDAKSMTNNPILSFKVPEKVKIDKLEIINFPLSEIPANYLSPLGGSLLSVKIHSTVPIRSISLEAFSQCFKLTSLELKSQITNDDNATNLYGVFQDLKSLENLKLINLNIVDLKLNYLTNLYSLSIENSNLRSISEDTFESNKNFSVLNIIGLKNSTSLINQFINWNTNFPITLLNLRIDNCYLQKFPKFNENFIKNLTLLSLTTNPIERIDQDDTVNLKQLQTLLLSGTNLNTNSVPGLAQLVKLKTLDISGIKTFTDLPIEIEQLKSLEVIHMDLLELTQISIALPSTIMKVSASHLKKPIKISPKFLSKCNKLIYLFLNNLDTNDIKFLVDNVDVFKDSLLTLSFDECVVLKTELWGFIKYLTKLEILFLNKANIDSIPDNVLSNLTNLKTLTLSGNVLRYDSINTIGFQNVSRRLTKLDLSFNQLIHLPPCLFHMIDNLSYVNLLETTIECDCNILWLVERITNQSVTFPLLNFTCASGKNARKSLYQLTPTNLVECSSKIDPCVPMKHGVYRINFDILYVPGDNKFQIININTFSLKYLFDFMKVLVKQYNKTYHSDVDKYGLNYTAIAVSQQIHSNEFTVCLVLTRNTIEYELDYNCLKVASENVITTADLPIWIGVPVGIIFIIILVVIITLLLRRKMKRTNKKPADADIYSQCSSKYSEPNDTYQQPDQYTEIISNEEYSLDPKETAVNSSYPFQNKLENIYFTGENLGRSSAPSKSFDTGLDIRRISLDKKRFMKYKNKSSRNKIKRLPEFTSLHNISSQNSNLPRRYSTINRSSLPRQYTSRELPITPDEMLIEMNAINAPPPKPKFPSTDLKNLLSNADNHLNYFQKYTSNNSLCTDESLNQHHSGDSGFGVSKLSNQSHIRMSEDNSVII